jgi:transposase
VDRNLEKKVAPSIRGKRGRPKKGHLNNNGMTSGLPNTKEGAMHDYHIGVDYHKKFTYIVVKDSRGKELRTGQVLNTKRNIKEFLKPFDGAKSHAVVEACRNYEVMYDWLDEIVDDVILANPMKVKAIAEAKIKTDKIDASVLSDLLRADLIPAAHSPSHQARELRMALRERMFFVRIRTMVKNRIYGIFDKYPEEIKKLSKETDLFGRQGRENLKLIEVSELHRTLIDRELELIDDLNAKIKAAEETIKGLTKNNGNVTRLKTIPGIGEFLARLIEAEIDDIHRFRNAKKLAAYAGLVPSTYSSGGRTVNGKIIKSGNRWLRWAFVEAVSPAVRSDTELKNDYERLKKRMTKNKAKVAMARRLLAIAYKVLKEERFYFKLNKLEQEVKVLSRLS